MAFGVGASERFALQPEGSRRIPNISATAEPPNRPRATLPSRARVGAAVLAMAAGSSFAAEQPLQLSDPKSFYEAFLDNPVVSTRGMTVGATIVGLRFEPSLDKFQPKGLRILLGRGVARPEFLCVRVISQDGRYFARAQYRAGGAEPDAPLVEFRSAFEDKLLRYTLADMAVSAFAGDKACDARKGSLLFALVPENPNPFDRLVVQVRAGNARVRAQLGRDNVAAGSAVLCEKRTQRAAVSFTDTCSILLPSPLASAIYQLSIGETGSTGEIVVKTYPIVLAPAIGR